VTRFITGFGTGVSRGSFTGRGVTTIDAAAGAALGTGGGAIRGTLGATAAATSRASGGAAVPFPTGAGDRRGNATAATTSVTAAIGTIDRSHVAGCAGASGFGTDAVEAD